MQKGKIFLIFLLLGAVSYSCGEKKKKKEEIAKLIQEGALIIDVRTPQEYSQGHYPNAINIPHTVIGEHLESLKEYKDKPIIVYCRTGRRSGIAKKILEEAGFKKVYNAGGLKDMPQIP